MPHAFFVQNKHVVMEIYAQQRNVGTVNKCLHNKKLCFRAKRMFTHGLCSQVQLFSKQDSSDFLLIARQCPVTWPKGHQQRWATRTVSHRGGRWRCRAGGQRRVERQREPAWSGRSWSGPRPRSRPCCGQGSVRPTCTSSRCWGGFPCLAWRRPCWPRGSHPCGTVNRLFTLSLESYLPDIYISGYSSCFVRKAYSLSKLRIVPRKAVFLPEWCICPTTDARIPRARLSSWQPVRDPERCRTRWSRVRPWCSWLSLAHLQRQSNRLLVPLLRLTWFWSMTSWTDLPIGGETANKMTGERVTCRSA